MHALTCGWIAQLWMVGSPDVITASDSISCESRMRSTVLPALPACSTWQLEYKSQSYAGVRAPLRRSALKLLGTSRCCL